MEGLKPLKTSSKPTQKPNVQKTRFKILVKREPFTTKKALELLLKGTLKSQVCRYCMSVTNLLNDLDQIMQIKGKYAMYKVSVRDMVATFHPFKVVDDPNFPNKICEKCLDATVRSYLFAQQCERSERALRNYFDDIYDKLEKLDPIERVKKRGRQKLHPNYNKLYTEHKNVIDYAEPIHHLINSGTLPLPNEPVMTELECKRCWQVLPNVESLVNHENQHPKSMWYNCRQCGRSFVKKFHLNKHLKSHKTTAQTSELEQAFECKQCGQISNDYNIHLQHIEKHKFSKVMQHLLKRTMDKLCSVCLDNASNLTDLDKRIILHGGYPELTGERSLFHILGATIPEVKNTNENQDFNKKSNLQVNELHSAQKYNFSLPIILSYIEDYDGSNVFSKSLTNEISNDDENIGNIDSNRPTNNKLTSEDHDNMNCINETLDDQERSVFNNENKRMNRDNVEQDLKLNNKDVDEKLCKKCWIFKKPTCVDCITKNVSNNENYSGKGKKITELAADKNDCKSCWVFKNARCEICKNTPKVSNAVALQDQITERVLETLTPDKALEDSIAEKALEVPIAETVPEVRNYGNTDVNPASPESSFTIASESGRKPVKRKIVESSSTLSKKLKWECNICLTANNTDRETCICCDYFVPKAVTNINWNNERFKQKIISTTHEVNIHFKSTDENITQDVDSINNEELLKNNEEQDITSERDSYVKSAVIYKSSLDTSMPLEEMDTADDTTESYSDVGQRIVQVYDVFSNPRSMTPSVETNMDICDDLSSHFENSTPSSEDIAISSMLQFSIGKGSPDQKNLKRSRKTLRRFSHK